MNQLSRYLAERPRRRFALFLLFMAVVAGVGIGQFVWVAKANSDLVGGLLIEAITSTGLLLPFLAYTLPKGRRSWQSQLGVGVASGLLLFALPSWEHWYRLFPFAERPWTQVPGDMVMVSFAIIATIVRTRQKFWQSDWSPTT